MHNKPMINESNNQESDEPVIDEGLTPSQYIKKLQHDLVTARLDRDAWVREWQNERILCDTLRDALLHACGAPGGLILAGPPASAIRDYDFTRK